MIEREDAVQPRSLGFVSRGDYVKAGIMSGAHAELLRTAVRERKNILVAGGTSTGKTTLVNALLAEVAKTGDRVVLIEDHRIVLDEPVPLARPRARGAAFDAIEERVLQRVLSKPGEEAAPTVQRIVPASEWRWAV